MKPIDYLEAELPPIQIRLDGKQIEALAAEYADWDKSVAGDKGAGETLLEKMVLFLGYTLKENHDAVLALHIRFSDFNKRYSGASTDLEKKTHILDFARELGAGEKSLKKDKAAFSRWFGPDAVTDRYNKRVSAFHRKAAFCLDRLGVLLSMLLRESDSPLQIWRRIKIERAVMPMIEYEDDTRVRIQAFKCFSRALEQVPGEFQKDIVEEGVLHYLFRAALDRGQDVWIQCEALNLLQSVSPETLKKALQNRLESPGDGDDFFVRRRALEILGRNPNLMADIRFLFHAALHDPSPFVRQGLVNSIGNLEQDELETVLTKLVDKDPETTVRGAAVLKITDLLSKPNLFEYLIKLLVGVFRAETDSFVVRVAIETANRGQIVLKRLERSEDAGIWFDTLVPELERIHLNFPDYAVRRWAAEARETMWVMHDTDAYRLKQMLEKRVSKIAAGKSVRIPRSLMVSYDEEMIGRTLSVISRQDYGHEIAHGLFGGRIYKGFRFDFRTWRFLHEFRNPSPDKRQAFSHTTGRWFPGKIQCPSTILSELTATKVPGEPLLMDEESGWRPYLPLVDQMLSSLDCGFFGIRNTKIYTSEGITEIQPPKWVFRRWFARFRLTLKFAQYAQRRNWSKGGSEPPNSYIQSLKKLGFVIVFNAYSDKFLKTASDKSVTRFFD